MKLFTNRWGILWVCVGLFAIGQFHRASGGVFSPILIEKLSVSATAVGTLVSAMFLANLAAQLPFGYALDRYGPKPVLILCLVTIALGTAIFALGGFRLDVLTGSRILIGLGQASMAAATTVIISRSFPSRDFGYVSGLIVTLGGIGGLLGTFPLAFALERLPWSVVFSAAAIAALLLAAFVSVVFKPVAMPEAVKDEAQSDGVISLFCASASFRKFWFVHRGLCADDNHHGLWAARFCRTRWGFLQKPPVPCCSSCCLHHCRRICVRTAGP